MKVLFFQTAHQKDDDRIAFHQRISLEQAGHRCAFADTISAINEQPDVVICDTPIALWRARKAYGRKTPLVYDITEWYPSKKNLRYISKWIRPLRFCILVLANLWAGWAADAFLFGEYYKARPFRLLFPWKKYLFLSYYPALHYIQSLPPRTLTDEVRLFYSGPQTAEKGYERVQRVAQRCQALLPDKHIVLNSLQGVPFETFCKEIMTQDFFLDLRDDDFENTRCLPIKLFYYMAAGRPVIYSNLKAIRKGVSEIVNDSLVRPKDEERAAEMICNLVSQPEEYQSICMRNRQLIENKYNWDKQSQNFVQFMEQIVE